MLKRLYSDLGKIIYVIFALSMILAFSYKCNYHEDEIMTYELSNSNHNGSWKLKVIDGKVYKPAGKPFLDYITVHPEHRFDYPNVWLNQSNDVHPPLYYAMVHTVCSFFPKRFSPWFAGVINFIFALLTLYVLRKLICIFIDTPVLINSISLAFVLSAGIISAITFLRMYVAALFWVTLLTYCFIREINRNVDDTNTGHNESFFLLQIFIVTLFGSLTHYYCIIYAVLISVLYGLYLLRQKRYKKTGYFCFAMTITGIVSYMIFPAMIHHILWTNRGQQIVNNASNISDFLERLRVFSSIIDRHLFGNFCLLLFLFVLVSLLYFTYRNDNRFPKFCLHSLLNNKQFISGLFLFIPAFLYFVIISKISVLEEDRYLFPIYAVVFLAIILVVIKMISFMLPGKKARLATLLVLCLITTSGWINSGWKYLYLDSKVFLERAANYTKVDCICIYYNRWRHYQVVPVFLEAKKYKSITFISRNNEKLIQQVIRKNKTKSSVIVMSLIGFPSNEQKNFVAKYIKKSKLYNSYEELGSFRYSASYVILKKG